MGDEADYLLEQGLSDAFDSYYEDGCEYWTCKDGSKIKIGDMGTGHIRNSINMIKRKPEWRDSFLSTLEDEIDFRQGNNHD